MFFNICICRIANTYSTEGWNNISHLPVSNFTHYITNISCLTGNHIWYISDYRYTITFPTDYEIEYFSIFIILSRSLINWIIKSSFLLFFNICIYPVPPDIPSYSDEQMFMPVAGICNPSFCIIRICNPLNSLYQTIIRPATLFPR